MTTELVPDTGGKPAPTKIRHKLLRSRWHETGVAGLFLLPALLGFLVFFLYPTLRGIYLSFTSYDLLSPPQWIGIDNFTKLWHDPLFWNALKVTFEYVVINIGAQTVLAVGLAVLIHRLTKSTAIRGAILLPYLIANVIVALLWYWMADVNLGVINQMLGWIGVDPVAFFGDSNWAIPTIAMVNVWKFMGYTALLIFAGLQTIPDTIYEAAAIDGAGEWKVFWRITLPLLRPVLTLVLMITIIGSWQIFDTVAVTTKGGPINATRVMQYYIYDQAFDRYNFGYASAISVVLFLILAGVALVQMKLMRADESDLA
ncbi:MAG TPA: sugar ABC transporter permease [Dermatophilaceae bacterium]